MGTRTLYGVRENTRSDDLAKLGAMTAMTDLIGGTCDGLVNNEYTVWTANQHIGEWESVEGLRQDKAFINTENSKSGENKSSN